MIWVSECHKVYFGNEHEMRKCSCSDWGKTGYMYKHFFAVFEKYTSWSINALLSIYINSPFLNLGKAAIPLLKKSTIPDATPTKKIVINLEEPDEINKNTALSNPWEKGKKRFLSFQVKNKRKKWFTKKIGSQ